MDAPHPAEPYRKKVSGRTQLALWLILGPTVLVALVFIAFAIINLIFNPTFWMTPDTEDFAATPLIITILNVALFMLGSAGIVAWLPGIIIGAVLLSKRQKDTKKL